MSGLKQETIRASVRENLWTKTAHEVLASQTRAFGNKAAKLQLQMATAAFSQAKQRLDAAEARKAASQEQE
jgi:hypothetical protein